ncbi:MAG: helix-turn-helix transcriptional regulator [Acidobacteriota bacterium]|nr:helix-turn-helix transcriptional regulator [Acidobacteriota bacterium]
MSLRSCNDIAILQFVATNRAVLDLEGFVAALDAHRKAKGCSWKRVAVESGVSASSITRMTQGRRPDVDTLASLALWASLDVNRYFLRSDSRATKWERATTEPLSEISSLVRSDARLTPRAAATLDEIIKVTYQQLSHSSNEEEEDL